MSNNNLIATSAAAAAQPKLSSTSKMPGKSWSLEAYVTCPGARERGKPVAACKVCYARKGFYHMPTVKEPRQHNKEDWQRDDWVDAMVSAIKRQKFFRWFDSGDMYDVRLAYKILQVMEATPSVRHWLPTRQHKFPKFHDVIRQMNALDNVVVRLSSDSVTGKVLDNSEVSPNNSVIASDATQNVGFVCEAYTRGGKCGDCRACWDKEVTTVTYPIH